MISNTYKQGIVQKISFSVFELCLIVMISCGSISVSHAQEYYHDPIDINNRTINTNLPVGAIEGMGGVNMDGSAIYDIPIFCPPGTNGLQPSISVNYSSNAGFGCLGWGWDVSGLSSISRTPKNQIQDGELASVEMTTSDVFSIDGNRLIPSGSMQSSNYYTEYADFTTITKYGTSGNGPSYFKVFTADGSILEYGNTSDSKTVQTDDASGTICVWRLNKVIDVNGNYMNYEYNTTTGLISKILYTGSQSFSPYNEIEFIYESREDPNLIYPGYSAPVTDNKLLTEIRVKCNGTVVKKYKFYYEREDEDIYSLLNEIKETDGADVALNSTVIGYKEKLDPASGLSFQEVNQTLFYMEHTGVISFVPQNLITKRVKWGSLASDPVCFSSGQVNPAQIASHSFPAGMSLNGHNSFFGPHSKSIPKTVYHPFHRVVSSFDEDDQITIQPWDWNEMYGDYNGDGYLDVFKARNIELTGEDPKIEWEVYLYNKTNEDFDNAISGEITSDTITKAIVMLQLFSADYDGNQGDEIFLTIWDEHKTGQAILDSVDIRAFRFTGSTLVEENFGIKNLAARGVLEQYDDLMQVITFNDLDGDKRQDEVVLQYYDNPGYVWIYMEGLPISSIWPPTMGTPDLALDLAESKFSILDFNGNGIPDFLITSEATGGGTQVDILEYNGTSFIAIEDFQIPGSLIVDSIFPGEFNGDGKTDMLIYNQNTELWNMYLSKGDELSSAFPSTLITDLNQNYSQETLHHMFPGDFNGDGKSDVFISIWDANNLEYHAYVYYSYGTGFRKLDYGIIPVQNEQSDWIDIYPVGDMNGDGNEDILVNVPWWTSGGHGVYSHICFVNENLQPTLIKTVTNGFNKTIGFDFKPLTDASVYTVGNYSNADLVNLNGAMYVVSSMTQPDALSGIFTTNYTYEGAVLHKYGKGFLGFTRTISEDLLSETKTTHEYVLDEDYLMMNLESKLIEVNNVDVSEVTYLKKTHALSGENGFGYYRQIFVFDTIVTSHDFLTSTYSSVQQTMGCPTTILQNKGNPVIVKNYYGSINNPDGWESTTYTYSPVNFTLPNSLSTSLVKLILEEQSSHLGGTSTATKVILYNYYTNSRLESVIDYYGYPGAITNTFTYNTLGNLTSKTSSASGMVSRYVNYTSYDTKGRFLLQKTDMLGQTENYTYHETWGTLLTSQDIAGNTTTYTYNSFGDLTYEDFPNDIYKSYNKTWSINSWPSLAIYYTQCVSPNAPDIMNYYDADGRLLHSRWDGMNNNYIAVDKEYNSLGQAFREAKPYFFNNGGPSAYICTTYDIFGRVTKVKDSVYSDTAVIHYVYSGKTVSITDPAGRESSKTLNNMGQLISSTDDGGELTYSYNERGQLKRVYLNEEVTITNEYDTYGRLIAEGDLNSGIKEYEYNNFGNIVAQTDANDNEYSMTYDNAGRILLKSGPEGDYEYTYITSGPGIGQIGTISLSNGTSQSFIYNNYGQVTQRNENFEGAEYEFCYSYDAYGNQVQITYPNRFSVTNIFNNLGMLVEVDNTRSNDVIWKLDDVDPTGKPYEVEQGDGLIHSYYNYDYHGFLTSIASQVQDEMYEWDFLTGNLLSRSDWVVNLTETFEYDDLDRLTRISMSGQDDRIIDYRENGNITSKTNAGTYTYDESKLNQVVNITDENNESHISHFTQNVSYTPFNKIDTITEQNEGGLSLVYLYGPDMERRSMVLRDKEETLLAARKYIGLFEIDGYEKPREICYIAGAYGITAMYVNEQMFYLRKDHQGSITGLIDSDGDIIEEQSFDAWGRKRNPTDWTYENVPAPDYLYRGYTFHEQMDEFGLINMNGRAYDPIVGRFLSADPFIQNSSSTQNYNRYSYCLNNPLKYKDPSGYRWSPIGDFYNYQMSLVANSFKQGKWELEIERRKWNTASNVSLIGVADGPKGNNSDGNTSVSNGIAKFAAMLKSNPLLCITLRQLGGFTQNSNNANGLDDNDPTKKEGANPEDQPWFKELGWVYTTYILPIVETTAKYEGVLQISKGANIFCFVVATIINAESVRTEIVNKEAGYEGRIVKIVVDECIALYGMGGYWNTFVATVYFAVDGTCGWDHMTDFFDENPGWTPTIPR